MEPAKPPPKLSPAEYAEMVKMKLRNTFPSHLNAMAKGVIDALNGLLSKSDVKIKNDLLEEQFEADLINKQLKAFDELWQNLELTESVTEMKRKIQEKPTIGANGIMEADNVHAHVEAERKAALKYRVTKLEEKVNEQQNALRAIFGEIEEKRELYDSVSTRRQKLVEVMEVMDAEMNENLIRSKEQRRYMLENDATSK